MIERRWLRRRRCESCDAEWREDQDHKCNPERKAKYEALVQDLEDHDPDETDRLLARLHDLTKKQYVVKAVWHTETVIEVPGDWDAYSDDIPSDQWDKVVSTDNPQLVDWTVDGEGWEVSGTEPF